MQEQQQYTTTQEDLQEIEEREAAIRQLEVCNSSELIVLLLHALFHLRDSKAVPDFDVDEESTWPGSPHSIFHGFLLRLKSYRGSFFMSYCILETCFIQCYDVILCIFVFYDITYGFDLHAWDIRHPLTAYE